LVQINMGHGVSRLHDETKEVPMSLITVLVLVAAMFAALSLFQGVNSMAHGGAEDQRASQWLMFRRVGWQALALLFILFALFASSL
jgi:ABC-type Na+ efflux pump permease subunit